MCNAHRFDLSKESFFFFFFFFPQSIDVFINF